MLKKTLAYALTAAMTLSFAAPAAYGSQESVPAQSESAQVKLTLAESETSADAQKDASGITTEGVWDTDIRLSIRRENEIRNEAGMHLREWDDAVASKKQEGKDAPLTEDAVLEANPDAQILKEDGVIYYIDHADALGDVSDALDAYRAAYSAAALMGGNPLADLRLWHQMEIDGVRFYSFQQISDGRMVMGSTLKLAVRDGKVCGVFSSLDPESGKEETLVTQEEAEAVVREKLEEEGKAGGPELLPDYTDRIRYMPTVLADLNLDNQDDDPVPEEVRWVVYSSNDDGEYPFIAHYVSLDGTFLESLPVEEPGSDEALCGFRMQRIFDGMEPDTWTGEIVETEGEDAEHGKKEKGKGKEEKTENNAETGEGRRKTVTLPVMRDAEGNLYLGDPVRRIAVADFSKAVYDDSHSLELVKSDDAGKFDNEDLYMYYNYLKAWDFYADMGWINPDGEGSDVVILKGLCFEDGTPFENACSLGWIQGWQMFGYTPYSLEGKPLGLGRGLDVMAHEYTHTFTGTVMNSNLYENDQGAINEAMSDIMGNLVEAILQETDDTRWLLGENTGTAIRSMSDPAAYQQPSFVWDRYYGPQSDTPNSSNDRGGVHINSSLLNQIAAQLCLDAGMEYGDAVRFWIMVTGGLTPKTDYSRICATLKWAMNESGNEAFSDSLDAFIKEKQLDREEIPEKLPYNRKIVRLTLPDTETFEDEYWTLMAFRLNTETVTNAAVTALNLGVQMFRDAEDAEGFGRILSEFMNSIHLDGNKIKLEKTDDEEAIADAVSEAALSALSRLLEQTMAWRGSVGEDIAFVTDDSPTFYLLLNVDDSGMKMRGGAALIGKRWVNLTPFLDAVEDITKTALKKGETEAERGSILDMISGLTAEQWESLFDLAKAVGEVIHPGDDTETAALSEDSGNEEIVEDLIDLATAALEYATADEEQKAEGILLPAKTVELPTKGLETVTLLQKDEKK